MRMLPFNQKVFNSTLHTGYLTVWEGSVRSSKTVASLIAWIRYMVESPGKVFLMSGRTLSSLYRNCINGEFGLKALTGGILTHKTDEAGLKYIDFCGKMIYRFGADTKVSYAAIRGITIDGWYADEVNLHNREFIEEALRRSIVSDDPRNFWTLNPDTPTHWIYKEYIDKYRDENLKGYRWHHLTLEDNPAMTPDKIADLSKKHSGVFYARYIKGDRVSAEGIIYGTFANNLGRIVIDKDEITSPGFRLPSFAVINIGVDFGGNKSASAFVATGFYDNFTRAVTFLEDNKKDSNGNNVKDSPSTFYKRYKEFVQTVKLMCPGVRIVVYADSAEQILINGMRQLAPTMGVQVTNSIKNAIVDRVRMMQYITEYEMYRVMHTCTNLIEGFSTAMWDESKQDETVRLDDGTTNIDIVDATEYSLEPYISRLTGGLIKRGEQSA